MRLYQRSRTLTPDDYRLFMIEGLGKKRVLEFGPGYSTFAFIEVGCEVVGLEHDPEWFEVQVERFKDYSQVKIDWYENTAPVAKVPEGLGEFDLALVDSPKGYDAARVVHKGQETCSRLNACLAALEHSPIVLLHDAARPLERNSLNYLEGLGHKVEFITAPPVWGKDQFSYGLARITRDGKNKSRPSLPDA